MKPTYALPEPKLVWERFFELVCVPRPSKEESPAIDFLDNWARGLNFKTKRDATGNLVVHVPATGANQSQPIILQCHVDIVAVTASGENGGADAARGRIPTVRGDLDPDNSKRLRENGNGDWILAPYTTLGADNGLGVAMMMALAESDQRPVPLQLLFTIDEEAGMTGAIGLDPTALGLTGKQLINIDTEDDDEITIGAAGGRDCTLTWKGKDEALDPATCWTLSLDGLKGGHSGVEINQGRANANRLLARLLLTLSNQCPLRLVSFRGGSRRNAIPDTATATFAVGNASETFVRETIERLTASFNELYSGRDNRVQPKLSTCQPEKPQALTVESTRAFLDMLVAIPTGICEMTPEIPVLVESSCNMAIIECEGGSPAQVICSVRGTTRVAIEDISHTLASIAQLTGAEIKIADGYPGWKPELHSQLLKTAVEQYKKLFNADPKVHAVHAGLECGLLIEKMPGLSAISIGPTIKGNHAVGERVQISSVAKSYRYLQAILEHCG